MAAARPNTRPGERSPRPAPGPTRDGLRTAPRSCGGSTATDAGGELFRGELLAPAVEEDGVGTDATGLVVEPGEEGGFGVEDLGVTWDGACGASDVVGEEAIGRLGFGAGGAGEDGGEGDLHNIRKYFYKK